MSRLLGLLASLIVSFPLAVLAQNAFQEMRPIARFTPSQLDFGEVGLGELSELVLQISNDGLSPLTITGTDEDFLGFVVIVRGTFPLVVPAGENVSITVACGAFIRGYREATLKIDHDGDGPTDVSLVGFGVNANSDITTVAGSFGGDIPPDSDLGFGGDGGSPTSVFVSLSGPSDVAPAADGTFYIADSFNHRIRQVKDGIITTIAGSSTSVFGAYSGDGGPATAAEFNLPRSVTVTPDGDIYVADSGNHIIRVIDKTGTVTTFAGNSGVSTGELGDGGLATNAILSGPKGIAHDLDGNIYIADTGNSRIRKVDGDGRITTIAGPGGLVSPVSIDVAIDGSVFFTDSETGLVHRVGRQGNLRIVAGTGSRDTGFINRSGAYGNSPQYTTFDKPSGVAVAPDGTTYISDSDGEVVWRVTDEETLELFAGRFPEVTGNPEGLYLEDDVVPTSAWLNFPRGLAPSPTGELLIADSANGRIRSVGGIPNVRLYVFPNMLDLGSFQSASITVANMDATRERQVVVSLSGQNSSDFSLSASSLTLQPFQREEIVVTLSPSAAGEKSAEIQIGFMGDASQHVIPVDGKGGRSIEVFPKEGNAGVYTVLYHGPDSRLYGGGGGVLHELGTFGSPIINDWSGFADGFVGVASHRDAAGLAVSPEGTVYFSDIGNDRIRKVDPDDQVTTILEVDSLQESLALGRDGSLYFMGKTSEGVKVIRPDGPPGNGEFLAPLASTDYDGKLGVIGPDDAMYYYESAVVYRVEKSGKPQAIAGTGVRGYSGDGGPATQAKIDLDTAENFPFNAQRIAVGYDGAVYLSEFPNNRIRVVSPEGNIFTLAGSGEGGLPADGALATQAAIPSPGGIAVAPDGTVYALIRSNSDRWVRVSGYSEHLMVAQEPAADADFDGDGTVGFTDFLEFAGAFGTSEGDIDFDAKYDLSKDGKVGFEDFLAFVGAFDESSGKPVSQHKQVEVPSGVVGK